MEVWLKDEKDNSMFRFPVIPMPIGKEGSASVDTIGIVKKGQVAVYNGTVPDSIKLDGFFPKYDYGFCNYKGFPSPTECVNIIETWKNKGTRLRFIVTGTPINIPVLITTFNYSYKNGTGNLYYSLSLMQKDDIVIQEWIPPKTKTNNSKKTSDNKTVVNKKRVAGSESKSRQNIHIVKKGEYLYRIAQKYYGDGRKYKKITTNTENLKRYPSLKKSNMIYVNWKLVIP